MDDKNEDTRGGKDRRNGDRRSQQVADWGFPERRKNDRRSGLDRRGSD